MQADFDTLKAFDFTNSVVHLWVFKKSTSARKYSAYYVRTEPALNEMLRSIGETEIAKFIEFAPYSYLAQTNENSCLSAPTTANDFDPLKIQVDRPEPENPIRSIADLKGATGYVVKFIHGGHTVYAVKRSTATWKTSYPKKYINMVFRNGELVAAENDAFSIEKNFDFYCLDQSMFIASKRAFESAMDYKIEYAQAFSSLRQNAQFSSLFTDLQPLVAFVGSNSIQLRRMATVEQKALYSQAHFLPNLQQANARHGWGINFEPVTNRIVPCDQTVRTILQILLDHRLMSEVTKNIYDVPDAVQV